MNVSEKLRRLSQSTNSMLRVVHLRGDLGNMAVEVKALEDKVADLQLHGEAVAEAKREAYNDGFRAGQCAKGRGE
jgi:cell division protein FtsB